MAGDLPFLDSFDHYDSAHSQQKWSSGVAIVAGGGRRGTAGAAVGGVFPMYRTFEGEYSTIYCGGAFYGATSNSPLALSNLLGGISVEMHAIGDGRFQMFANGVPGNEVTPPILGNRWYYLEMKAHVTPDEITVEFRINEQPVLGETYEFPVSIAPEDPRYQHLGWCTLTIHGKGGGIDTKVDDIYVDDEKYFGDINIDVIRPDGGLGGSTSWDADPAVDNWNNVKDIVPDDDASIVSTATIDAIDTYSMEDIAPDLDETVIMALQGLVSVKKSTAGLAALKIKYGTPGGTVLSREFYPSETDYWYARDGRKTLNGALSSGVINDLVFGQKRTQ